MNEILNIYKFFHFEISIIQSVKCLDNEIFELLFMPEIKFQFTQ